MRHDIGTNYTVAESHEAKEWTAAANNGDSVDHKDGGSVTFFLTAGTIGGSGTVDMKVQYSDDDSSWTDDPGTAGNDDAITQIVAAGTAQLDVPNPLGRYSRVIMTTAVATSIVGVVSILGPLRVVDA